MTAPEPLVMEALQGFTDNADKWPGPRIVKIFISSVFNDFREERKQILEVVGPELQSTYDDRNIEVEFVDMHYGCDGGDENNPRLLRCHLEEIRSTHRTSRAGFFLCILGGDAANYKPALPLRVKVEHFEELLRQCDKLQLRSSILQECYRLEGDQVYELVDDDKWYDDLTNRSKQRQSLEEVQQMLCSCALAAVESCGAGGAEDDEGDSYSTLLRSPMEIQCALALELLESGLHPHGVIAVIKEISVKDEEGDKKKLAELAKIRLDALKGKLEAALPKDNVICLHDEQTELVRDGVMSAVDSLIDATLSSEPDHGKGRKKTVQEVFQEHITHLRTCIEHNTKSKITSKQLQAVSDCVIDHMKQNYKAQTKHTPCIIHGPDASGKTTLLTHLYDASESIFPKPGIRIIRFSAATPRSAYNLELLRVLCQQISIVLKIPEGYLPKDASFDPLYINNWFQNLLRRCEELDNEVLMIFIDNVHRVNPLECDIVNGLSWLPMILPKNVYFICTTAVPLEQLQLTTAQKEKFRSTNCYHLLEAIEETGENMSHGTYIEGQFDKLEKVFGVKAFSKLASYMTCSEFGLTETELLELLMPTSNSDAVIQLQNGNFTFSTLCFAKTLMAPLLVEKCVSGRLVVAWRAAGAGARARRRYVRAQGTLRDAHSDLAALYFAHFCTDDDDDEETKPDEDVASVEPEDDDALLGSTPFHSASRTAAAFTQRHVEESWLHLLLAGDFVKLKDLTVCNFDFLLAAVQTVTISYLRCVLEHVRCYILDRDVELVYGAVKKASDILTRDPMQLGSQIIACLRPAVSRRGVLATLVTAAMAWCDGYDKPLLVPLNGWLHPPIASTVRVLSVGGGGARLLQLAPSSQHLVLAPAQGDPQLWHLMSNSRVHTFKGHSGRVLCMAVTRESQFLLTGSEDTTVIVWDLHTLAVKLKIAEHIAPVLCVAAAVSRSLVISGGEDSAIIVTSLHDGSLVTKLDHHRGPVTGIKIVQDGEILVSCSQDGTVCSWSTDSFSLLNTIATDHHAPIQMMELSEDSVFLLTLEPDNELHLRTFLTGTHIHTLKRHKAKVTCFCIAGDSARAAVGCADQRVLVYSLHSAALLRALPAAHDLTALAVTHHDHFLLAAGGNRVTVYSFHTEDAITNFRPTKQKRLRQTKSTTTLRLLQAEQSELIPISCLEVSRDGQLGASGCAQGVVRVWQLSTHRLAATLRAHMGHVTCVCFSPNNLLVLSGSEDRSVVVWQLADHLPIRTYRGHTAAIQSVSVMGDGRRAVSGDRARVVHVWLLDSGIVLHTATDTPTTHLAVTNNMKFAVCTDFDNTVRIWSLSKCEEALRTVSHAERVTCLVLTIDGSNLVTGSEDMSLKVWQVDGGKLSQVLVGHTGAVSCAAVSVSCRAQVVSGSYDGHLIVWDINTGADLHLLSGHLAKVTCVKLTGDGTIAVSGSEDKTLIIWETKRGLALTSLALHVPLVGFQITNDCSRLVVHLQDRGCLPIICLHNTPAVYVKIPTYAAPTKDIDELRPLAPKRPMRRLLKKEVSLDTYTWQKKYGHLTSAVMMAQVDERLKRRFSVSASMEEISKIQQEKNKDLGSQASLGPEQAALAQSQHFDQLEALWNKVSPPRSSRRSNKSITKQSSLIESRFDSSDEEHTPVDEQEHMLE